MSEHPDLTAPSPADGPTTPGTPAVPSEPGTVPVERETRPVERETERLPGGTAGLDHAPEHTVPGGSAGGAGGAVPTRTTARRRDPGLTRIGGAWVGLIVGAVLLIFLLVFVLQNLDPARVYFLGWQAELPLGIWLLFAAIAGVLLLAIPGLGRMIQWRRAAKGGSARR